MTKTEEFIISEKDKLKNYIKTQVDNYNKEDTNIWGQLMTTVLPEIHKFEKEIVSVCSSIFEDNPKKQKLHYYEMTKHSKEVREYYDELINNF